jgi:uncharacterized membrane protein HdeD (DUF308 family)
MRRELARRTGASRGTTITDTPFDAGATAGHAHMRVAVKRHSGLLLLQAALLIIGGAVALVYPLLSTLAVTLFLGWMLIFVGIVQAITVIAARNVPHFWWQLISAVLAVITGLIFVRNPGIAVATLALLLIIFFMVEGIAKVAFALTVRPLENWGWVLASGIIGLAIGVWLLFNPALSLLVLGIFIGIQFIVEGVAIGYMALAARKT